MSEVKRKSVAWPQDGGREQIDNVVSEALQLTKAVDEHTAMLQDQSRRLRALILDSVHQRAQQRQQNSVLEAKMDDEHSNDSRANGSPGGLNVPLEEMFNIPQRDSNLPPRLADFREARRKQSGIYDPGEWP